MSLDVYRRNELIDRLSQRAARLGITSPAILFLEMHKPLAFLGAQLLWATQPLLGGWGRDADVRDIALLLEDRAGVDALIERLASIAKVSA